MARIVFMPDRDPDGPVARLRAHGFARELRGRGHETIVLDNPIPIRWTRDVDLAAPIVRGSISMARQLKTLRRGDILYLVRVQQLPLLPFYAVAKARSVGAHIVYDFDDAVQYQDPIATRLLARAADAVVIAGQGNMEFASQWARAVHIAHTPFDPADFPAPSPDPAKVVIGWSGTPSNLGYLTEIRGVIEEVCAQSGAVFRLITRPLSAVRDQVPAGSELVEWKLATYRQEIARFHVGLSPLADDRWTRGKLGYKAIEYQASGVPAVASTVLAKDSVVADGETGFYAQTPAEWRDRLMRIVEDAPLRARMASKAQAHVAARFSYHAVGAQLEAVISSLSRN